MNIPTRMLRGLVHAYRLLISPVLPPTCRYTPNCSEYALGALAKHGVLKGSWLAVRRLGRCQPWGGSGDDPVPEANQPHSSRHHNH